MSLGFWGQILQNGAADIGGPYLRDYRHASKTFLPNNYAYAPKLKFLFHVYFDINTQVYNQNLNTGNNFGLAVKKIKLPSFTMNTETMNQYNRKKIVQTKIKYNPVNVSFHDDNANMVTRMWEAYYTYYYSDGTKIGSVFNGTRGNPVDVTVGGGGSLTSKLDQDYNNRNTYNPNIAGNANWGYNGDSTNPNLRKIPFFKNITIFGLHQHKFTAYSLINPVITNLNHDTFNYEEGAGTMEVNMDLDYETVVYNEGAIDGETPDNIIKGFGLQSNYDRFLSPLTFPGDNSYYPGQGGYVPGSGGTIFNNKG